MFNDKSFICTICGYTGKPKTITKGSFLIEVILWLCFLVPGIIYSIWRMSAKQAVCQKCKNPSMIPVDSPVGTKLASEYQSQKPPSPAQTIPSQDPNLTLMKKVFKIIVWVIGILLALSIWYIALPIIVPILIYRKTPFARNKKLALSGIAFVILAILGGIYLHLNRVPTIHITSPTNNTTAQEKEITITGNVDPSNAKVAIANQIIPVSDGKFSYDAKLANEENTFTFTARNGSKTAQTVITINRTLTDDEKVAIEQQKAAEIAKQQAIADQAKKDAEEQRKKRLAEQKAWESTKAGQLCKKHPDWTKSDCTNVADKKYWIGMSYDMLVASYGGKPNHANPSNYGGGTQWQWCWSNYTPSCFYDNNGDGLVDSFN